MMDKIFKVNLYVETSKGGRIREGRYGWMVEYIVAGYGPVTREGYGTDLNTTPARLELFALIDAFTILTKDCEVRVFSPDQTHGHIEEWFRNGWKNAKGNKVKNVDLWERLHDLMDRHLIEYAGEDEPNTARSYLQTKIREAAHE